jgi:hypothetical protein
MANKIKIHINTFLKKYLLEIIKTIAPIIIFVIILHFFIIRMPTEILLKFFLGTLMVVVGLNLFLKGIMISILPIGEKIGSTIPKKHSLAVVLLVGFIVGFAITIAEPDVRVLASQIDLVSDGKINKHILSSFIGIGVGLFLLIALIRIFKNIPIIYILFSGYLIILALSFFTPPEFIPVSFDAGGVTTGPLTVPFIMSLGIGLVSILGGKSRLSEGFGLIGIASIGPVITVMILGVIFG